MPFANRVGLLASVALAATVIEQPPTARTWKSDFPVDKATLVASGRNRYVTLEPGHVAVLDGGGEHLVITVTTQTELVDGVTTRVVEERETKGGALVEVSRNYLAISTRDSSVYYFGEDVDMYEGGTVVHHEGSWRAGVNGARFGLLMPHRPVQGMR